MGRKSGSSTAAAHPSFFSSFSTIFMHADAIDVALMTLGFVGAVGDGVTLPLMLYLTSTIFNNFGNGPASVSDFAGTINEGALKLIYLACGSFVASFLEGYCWTRTGERQAARMRQRYLRAVMRQDIEYFDLNAGSGTEVITGVSSDSLVVQDVLSEKVPNFVMNASTFVGSYVTAFVLMWRLALVAFPAVVLLIIPGLMYGRYLMGLARKIREEYNKAGTVVEQSVSSIRTVYSFVAEERTIANFSSALDHSVKLGLKQGLAKGMAIGSNAVTFAIWSFMIWALGSGLSNVKYFSEASSAGERIMEVIQRVPKIDTENEEGDVLDSVSGNVEFKGVEFAYPSRPESLILRGFNLQVPAGRTVALVGSSGSGKSTVIALLERFYDPLGGGIFLDGVDIRSLKLKWLRSQMGLVSQEPALFATSIKENIIFGKEDATMEEVVAAAKAANAHNFISQLPRGYDTEVGERGVQMSGGQKQRIAIARAVLKSPKILLLDEATSALDTESERVVQEALDLASVGRTTIVIAHRLSTIQNADVITVVQDGRVMEMGSHDALIADQDGLYSSLIRLQHAARESRSDQVAGAAVTSSHVSSGSISRRRVSAASRTSSSKSLGGDDGDDHVGESSSVKAAKLPVPSFRRLLRLNSPEWRQAVLGSISAIVFGAIQPLYAFCMGNMIAVFFSSDHDEIKSRTRTYAFIFLSLTVLSFIVNVGQHYNFGAMGEYLTKRVRMSMLSKILTFEVGWFDEDENATGAVCARFANDANVVRSLVGDRMALLIQTTSAVVIACTMGLVIAWRLAVVMIAVQPIIIMCFYARRVLLKRLSAKAIKSQAASSKLASEAVGNLRTITAFSSQGRILRMFNVAQQGPRRESIRQSWFAGAGLSLSNGLSICIWALDFWYGGKLVDQGHLGVKALFQTFMILVSTGRVIADAGSMTTDLAKGADAVASVFAVLDRYTLIEPDDQDAHRIAKLTGEIDICKVDFAYPARPDVVICRGFSLYIEAGKSTALVGQSGSGKSTIIGLLERFYDPLKGTVKIDGKDIKSYNLRSLRRHIGLVGQEPTLFSGTIRENIAYGADGATEAEIEEAARAANAHDFISGLKDGYETYCGDRGTQLSGGQKQRVAIARAILKNPAILLLDEATSALDGQSEKLVQEALERMMVGRTSVVVAHRLSTIRNCDLIAVLDQGVVVEKGTHASLLAKERAYYNLVSLQQGNPGP
ncbi:hypothetical protein ZIOFF_020877 [Zingiber officinale]|uniref:Uncharacterized protein n=1 Tax=Zingiber officinale TaxID=94328 RepID=A0A8J5H7N4_ZINOF|nr:hypothetical protein ZIOFF_020877 [Zingiber officinale]